MDVDIVCVGFGPATAGFLTTLSRQLVNPDGTPVIESPSNPGLPLQVMCYERADDVSFGVSGVVTRARGIRASFPDLDPGQIPMAVTVKQEKVAYLLDPADASRRSATMHFGDGLIRSLGMAKDHAVELPYIPPFLHKEGGLVMSLGTVPATRRHGVHVQRRGTGLAGNARTGSAHRKRPGVRNPPHRSRRR